MIKKILTIIAIFYASSVSSEVMSTAESERIISDGKIISSKLANSPFSLDPESMFFVYAVVYKRKYYICYGGISDRGNQIDRLVEGIVLRCTNND